MSAMKGRIAASLLALTMLAGAPQLSAGQTRPGGETTAARPNVLLIMIDDLKPAIHGYGDATAITPNIDRLIARGTRFDLAYANQAVCAPSRINLMTGARSTSSGIYDFGMNLRDYMPRAVTLPQYFMAAGYRAESMGKVFHIGHGTVGDPQSWSAPPHKDHVIEYVSPEAKSVGHTREEALFNEFELPDEDVWEFSKTLPKGAAWEDPEVPDDAYADGRTAEYAIGRLKALRDGPAPFFLAVGFARPHLPFSVPKKYWNLYDPVKLPMPAFERLPDGAPAFAGKVGGEINAYTPVPEKTPEAQYPDALKRKLIHGYYAGVSYVDAQIGKVLDELERSGQAKNTIVVLWGDHGYHLGDHAIWTKHTNFEQATHQPLIFAGPGIAHGAATRQPAETVDIFPTLAALVGLAPPRGPQPIDGISLKPVLENSGRRLRGYAYHFYNRPHRWGQAIRTEQYRLVRWTHDQTGERVYELYDLLGDPEETRNIAAEKPAIVKSLDAILNRQPDPKPLRNSG
ncbi:MAG: iduronate-2-sulfatase [Novosphingobium pentaromativorans]|uniref:Iduronate-2-sulfatase n=1 Tax=Novosphingobium pentaromativorans TaxID=205844 RepID=A0A2W5QZD3_9SPHN|nr:MAG: iduronate-2-sulfatase [Novosphingobium pentaromativorans]